MRLATLPEPLTETLSGDAGVQPIAIRIVIADDHPIFRDGLKQLLGAEPDFLVVAEAGDSDEALEAVEQYRPDVLLLDLIMPGAGGLAILQRLQGGTSSPKVIVLTGSEDKNDFIQAMKLGASGIVLKQSPTELLRKSIRKVHQGEIWLDSGTTAAVLRQFSGSSEPGETRGRGKDRALLSQREREVVALVTQGFKNKEMAEKLLISEQTVKNHLHNIFEKLGVSDRLELALYAIHRNLHAN